LKYAREDSDLHHSLAWFASFDDQYVDTLSVLLADHENNPKRGMCAQTLAMSYCIVWQAINCPYSHVNNIVQKYTQDHRVCKRNLNAYNQLSRCLKIYIERISDNNKRSSFFDVLYCGFKKSFLADRYTKILKILCDNNAETLPAFDILEEIVTRKNPANSLRTQLAGLKTDVDGENLNNRVSCNISRHALRSRLIGFATDADIPWRVRLMQWATDICHALASEAWKSSESIAIIRLYYLATSMMQQCIIDCGQNKIFSTELCDLIQKNTHQFLVQYHEQDDPVLNTFDGVFAKSMTFSDKKESPEVDSAHKKPSQK